MGEGDVVYGNIKCNKAVPGTHQTHLTGVCIFNQNFSGYVNISSEITYYICLATDVQLGISSFQF